MKLKVTLSLLVAGVTCLLGQTNSTNQVLLVNSHDFNYRNQILITKVTVSDGVVISTERIVLIDVEAKNKFDFSRGNYEILETNSISFLSNRESTTYRDFGSPQLKLKDGKKILQDTLSYFSKKFETEEELDDWLIVQKRNAKNRKDREAIELKEKEKLDYADKLDRIKRDFIFQNNLPDTISGNFTKEEGISSLMGILENTNWPNQDYKLMVAMGTGKSRRILTTLVIYNFQPENHKPFTLGVSDWDSSMLNLLEIFSCSTSLSLWVGKSIEKIRNDNPSLFSQLMQLTKDYQIILVKDKGNYLVTYSTENKNEFGTLLQYPLTIKIDGYTEQDVPTSGTYTALKNWNYYLDNPFDEITGGTNKSYLALKFFNKVPKK